MFHQDFDADADEDNAAQKLDLQPFDLPEAAAAEHAEEGEGKGGEGNDGGGHPDAGLEKCHADADGEGVDARGDSQGEQHAGGKGDDGLFFFLERFVNHFSAEVSQEDEGYPVVKLGDVRAEAAAEEPAQPGHAALEPAHDRCHFQGMPPREFRQA